MKKIFLILFSIFYFLASEAIVLAAPRLYLEETNQAVVGNTFSVRVLLDADQALNAYSVTLRYSTDFLEPAGFNNGHSIIDVWRGDPVIASGEIKLSGGSLVPFKGFGGELITLNFKALKEGAAGIALGDSRVYLSDGKGTKVLPESGILQIMISGSLAALMPTNAPIDTTPPQIKISSLTQDPFNQKQKFLTFLVSDSDSGVKKTEVRTISYLWWSAWTPVQNPAALSASVWAAEFRATDNSGNAAESVLYDKFAFVRFLVEISLTTIVAIFITKGFIRFRKP